MNPRPDKLGLDKPSTITIGTFEGFHYVIQAGDKQGGKMPMTVSVTADYPREREVPEKEDDSVKAQKDKTFAEQLQKLDDKLEKEKALGKWTYLVYSYSLDSVMKKRGDLLKKPEPAKKPADTTTDASAPSEDPLKGVLDVPPADK